MKGVCKFGRSSSYKNCCSEEFEKFDGENFWWGLVLRKLWNEDL